MVLSGASAVGGISVYKRIRHHIKDAAPFWPLGLPVWGSDWLTLGLRNGPHLYLEVWRCGGEETTCRFPMPELKGHNVETRVLYPDPQRFEIGLSWTRETGNLSVSIPVTPSARLICLK